MDHRDICLENVSPDLDCQINRDGDEEPQNIFRNDESRARNNAMTDLRDEIAESMWKEYCAQVVARESLRRRGDN